VREGYDRWAEIYDHDANPLLPIDERVVARLLGDVNGLAVLELACGTARHTVRLADAGARVTAIDFSPGMLTVARTRAAGRAIAFGEGDLREPLGFPDLSFDVVLCCLALEHIERIDFVFREVHRVLRPGGAFVCSDMHPAMRLRGQQANFDDPTTGVDVRVQGYEHPIAEYVTAALDAGFRLAAIEEHKGDEALAEVWPRARKYIGWPMLVALRCVRP
jgi:malonyl-CoA O-methyltransferase